MDLKKIIKALLISTTEPISIKDLQNTVRRYREGILRELESTEDQELPHLQDVLSQIPELLTAEQVREAFDEIIKELEIKNEVYRIIENPDGYRLVLEAEYAPWVRIYRNEDKPMKLSNAVMETLALVAYRQPVTRAEMEMVRGVAVDNPINKLLENELIYVTGYANLPGKPKLYATTEKFLNFCGIQSLEDLPTSDVLSAEHVTQWVQEAHKRELFSEQALDLSKEEQPASINA